MTPNEFVIWLRGFVEASHSYNITPKQWDSICDQLEKVKEPTNNSGYIISTTPGVSGIIATTTAEGRGDITYNNSILTTKTILND